MAYFDSLKNQAKWNTELAVLRREREERRRQGYVRQEKVQPEAGDSYSSHRRPITLDDLIAMEQKEKAVKRQKQVSRIREKQKESQKESQKEAQKGPAMAR